MLCINISVDIRPPIGVLIGEWRSIMILTCTVLWVIALVGTPLRMVIRSSRRDGCLVNILWRIEMLGSAKSRNWWICILVIRPCSSKLRCTRSRFRTSTSLVCDALNNGYLLFYQITEIRLNRYSQNGKQQKQLWLHNSCPVLANYQFTENNLKKCILQHAHNGRPHPPQMSVNLNNFNRHTQGI